VSLGADDFSSGIDTSFDIEVAMDTLDHNRPEAFEKREMDADRTFYVRAPSVSAVRRALDRAPGGARVVGRHDRATIQCTHTMDGHSFGRHWRVIVSRLSKAGLAIVARPPRESGSTTTSSDETSPG
jgi:hypothetical protein